MIYIYSSHLGSLYTTDYEQSYDELYCETCGDSDYELWCGESTDDFIRELTTEWLEDNCLSLDYIAEELGYTMDEIKELNPNVRNPDCYL